ITLATYPSNFNCSNTNNTLKNRSDDKGPEPEAMTIGVLGDSTYAFIGLERIGGVMIYNITNPNSPYFVQYINTRNFTQTPGVNLGGDLGPEGILFVPAGQSPNGKPMLIVSNEISGTVTIFNINAPNTFKLQILHSSDMESGIDAPIDAPNFAAVLDTLEDTYPNTLRLASGDCYIPGPFLASGEDPSLVTPLRSTASSYYAGTTSGLRAAIGRIDIAMMNIMGFQGSALGNHEFDLGTPEVNSIIGVDIRNNGADKRWIGAQFPYLSANLDFSADANLNYLVTNNQLNWHEFKTSPSITANSQKKGIAPSAIIEVNGEKIGIVGATTQVLASISSPGSTTVIGASTNDMPQLAAILQPVIDTLRIKHGINKIIVMSHLQQLANEKALAPLLKGVDIIIAGGSHALCTDGTDRIRPGTTSLDHYPIMTQNLDNEPLAILNTSAEWKYLGRFVVSFDSLGVMLPSSLDSTINGAYAADSQMVQSLYGTYADGFKVNSKGALVRTLTTAVANVINNKDGNLFGKTNVYLEGTRNQVRKEESNLGNLSSDANLWYAKLVDPSVKISLKNGGGIRSSIGAVVTVGSVTNTEPPLANPGAGKPKGAISQLDIENSLRFNNKLSILTMNAAAVKRIVEHGLAATNATATPGQFPQVGGIAFSYDYSKPAGNRVWSLVTLDSLGNKMDTIVREGMLYGDTTRQFKMVTLDFLAGGGDGYPFAANSSNRVNLDTAMTQSMFATFAGNGSEQDAFAEFMYAKHSTNAFNVRDTNLYGDKRIQQLNTRPDAIFPETNPAITIAAAKLVSPPNNVRIRGVISRAWGRFIYIQDATSGIAVRQSSGQMVNEILSGSLKEGDSVEVLGPRNDFNNYAQIQLASGNYSSMNTVIKIASTTKVQPKMVTISQMLANAEEYENVLVRIKGVRTSATGNFSASTNYTIWDGPQVGDTTLLRVISALDTEMEDAPALAIPQDTFTFEGILAQFCSSPSNGCTTGYQLYGVRKADIVYNYPVSISEARSIAAPTLVKTRGVISRAWGRFIYIQDASGAIAVRQSAGDMVTAITNGDLKEGDSVEVFGPRNDFNNYAQFQLASGSYSATNYVVKLGVGSKVIAKNITVKDLLEDAENHESELVRIKGLRITGTGNFASSTNYTIWDGTQVGDSILLRVISGADTELEDAPETAIPQDTFTFEGILAQFCSSPSNGCSTGYQLYGVRKADIIYTPTPKPTINSFNLVSPANNAVVVVESGSTSPLSIVWTNAKATTYKWMAILPTGNFTAPLLVLPSNNSGMDTTLTLVSGSVDAILAGIGILPGQSANLKWTVFAYLGTDSLKANQDYNITLTRKLVLGTFNLLTPANNARVEVEAGGTQNVDITWSASANATRYAWYLATTAGSFATPIVSLNSDNSGTDTKLTLVSGTVDALLATNGVAQGDSIVLKWTVYSFAGTDSIKAQQDNQINLVRKKAVGLSSISLNQLVTFYPNPVQSKLYITSDLNLTGAKILVYDLQGRVVINENYSTEGISMEGLSKGMYQVVLKNGDAQATAKVIVE
ncbi:MAG: 5'-nucleotidase C-terminal domain-containing protein, partial [Bacteroidia bacterium]|nr:5'-nucleotidase C-terminal domain-containing protein [Bacteroidia bacterium]